MYETLRHYYPFCLFCSNTLREEIFAKKILVEDIFMEFIFAILH